MDRRTFLAGLFGGTAAVATGALAAQPARAHDINSVRVPDAPAPGANEAVELEAHRRGRRRRVRRRVRRGWYRARRLRY